MKKGSVKQVTCQLTASKYESVWKSFGQTLKKVEGKTGLIQKGFVTRKQSTASIKKQSTASAKKQKKATDKKKVHANLSDNFTRCNNLRLFLHQAKTLQQFVPEQVLGAGEYGVTIAVLNKETNERSVLKLILWDPKEQEHTWKQHLAAASRECKLQSTFAKVGLSIPMRQKNCLAQHVTLDRKKFAVLHMDFIFQTLGQWLKAKRTHAELTTMLYHVMAILSKMKKNKLTHGDMHLDNVALLIEPLLQKNASAKSTTKKKVSAKGTASKRASAKSNTKTKASDKSTGKKKASYKSTAKKKASDKGTGKKAKGTAKKKPSTKGIAKKKASAKGTAKKKKSAKGTAKKKPSAKKNSLFAPVQSRLVLIDYGQSSKGKAHPLLDFLCLFRSVLIELDEEPEKKHGSEAQKKKWWKKHVLDPHAKAEEEGQICLHDGAAARTDEDCPKALAQMYFVRNLTWMKEVLHKWMVHEWPAQAKAVGALRNINFASRLNALHLKLWDDYMEQYVAK